MEIVQKRIVDILADDSDVEYFGMIDEDIFFAIYRPERDNNWDNSKVNIGPWYDIKEVKVAGGTRYRSGTTVINTVAGTFFFPSPNRKDKRPLFNSRPIELL